MRCTDLLTALECGRLERAHDYFGCDEVARRILLKGRGEQERFGGRPLAMQGTSLPPHRPAIRRPAPRQALAAAVVEADAASAALLAAQLTRLGADVVAIAGTVDEAAGVLSRRDYDVAFLSAQLGSGTRRPLAPLVRDGAAVVFVANGGDHAAHAFEINAVDYIVKPVTDWRLAEALQRVRQRGVSAQSQPSPAGQTIVWSSAEGERLVSAQDILAVFSSENYSQVVTQRQRWLVRRTMSEWEAMLPPDAFMRVHRTAIVNLAAVETLDRRTGETSLVRLRGFPQPIRVSRSRQLALRVALVERR